MVNHHHDGGYVVVGGHRYRRRDLWRGRGYARGFYRQQPTTIYVQQMAEPNLTTGLIVAAGIILVGGLAVWASSR